MWLKIKASLLAFLALCRNPDFNFVSQCAHIGWSYVFVTMPALLFHVPLLWTASCTVTAAAIKEEWDAHGLETPAVAGNSYLDFAFWCIGVALAILALKG